MVRFDMERRLTELFDFQRFERDPALQSVLDEVEVRYFSEELSDDVMYTVSAAGEPRLRQPDLMKQDEPL